MTTNQPTPLAQRRVDAGKAEWREF